VGGLRVITETAGLLALAGVHAAFSVLDPLERDGSLLAPPRIDPTTTASFRWLVSFDGRF
jgi:hypothetical protein